MLSILKNRTFLLLFLGNTISLIGFGFNLVGVSWLVLEVTGSELALGKLMAMATVPGVVLALFAKQARSLATKLLISSRRTCGALNTTLFIVCHEFARFAIQATLSTYLGLRSARWT